ncbi:MAG TPA: ATP-binding protein [Bacteroidota bacterium]|nr:ATP-binding protein [Bacteroidota bacterium]
MNSQEATLTIENSFDELRRLAEWLRATGHAFGLPKPTIDDLDFCSSELVTNTISYAFNDDVPHRIVVRLTTREGSSTLEIEDDGKPFDPSATSSFTPPRSLEEASIGGYGIYLVQQFMDELSYRRVGNKNVVTMRHA